MQHLREGLPAERSQQQYGSRALPRVFLQAWLLLQHRLARGAPGGPCSGLLPCEPLVPGLPGLLRPDTAAWCGPLSSLPSWRPRLCPKHVAVPPQLS